MDRSTPRTPMFFCYECNAEMRPLMMPDPHCASCHGTFVEEIPSSSDANANPDAPLDQDDPRNFQVDDPLHHFHQHDHDHPIPGGFGPGLGGGGGNDPIIQLMNAMMGSMAGPGSNRGFGTPSPVGVGGNQATIRFDMTGGGRGRVFIASGPGTQHPINVLGGGLLGSTGGTRSASPGAAGGAQPPTHPLESLLSVIMGRPIGTPGSGPLGDYVFDQHGLDEIITQLMEQSQGARPVAAPDEMIAKLPRTQVTADSPLTQKECAVCKDTFAPTTEDGEEVIAVTLPCSPNPKYQHTFHEDCIVPWLKQNGTCPVCRFQLVPQPQHHAPPGAGMTVGGGAPQSPPSQQPPSGSNNNDDSSQRNRSRSGSVTDTVRSGMTGLWDLITGNQHQGSSSSSSNGSGASQPQRRGTGGPGGNSQSRSGQSPPGGWDTLD
ncbi:hypothetical protein FRB94_002941 [Tulasnella sp. JGI-2019a]|nr:hypothetical protein FRB94_002941 [Tulasnella sp. JGI-2019a]KAG9034748.1 hypothetical protein FRB95_012698 [Tulasnella sp. JGI-2019a]